MESYGEPSDGLGKRAYASISALVLVWLVGITFNKWLATMPLFFVLGLLYKASMSNDFCPLCFSFYGSWMLYLALYLAGNAVVPMWVIASMMAYSASKVSVVSYEKLEELGLDFPLSWPWINYVALFIVLYLVFLLS